MRKSLAYLEIIDFIAAGPSSAEVAEFRPSEKARRRVMQLLQRQKAEELRAQEKAELDHYMELEHLMRLAKARARRHLSG